MSLHASRPEIEARLRQHRRMCSITSAVIGVLVVLLVMLVLSLLWLAPLFREAPTIITYQSNAPEEAPPTVEKFSTRVERTPSSPSSSMARVLAAMIESPVAVPVSDTVATVPAVDFGNGDDFGDGWGDGDGSGAGGGATFFNQQVKAARIAYVIDFSLSMRGVREKLMRDELRKSVTGLSSGMSYQLIFFAGPAWVAGDQVQMPKGRSSATVATTRGEFDWICGGKAHEWHAKGAKQAADWILCGPAMREQSLNRIDTTQLVWGTNWEPALAMALAMNPPPEVVFFMTDGVTGGDSEALAKGIAAKAKAKKIRINTVAMMEPKAEAAMQDLAKRTGGLFTIIEAGGKVRQVPAK